MNAFDLIVILYGDHSRDARAMNFFSSADKLGLKVALISSSGKPDASQNIFHVSATGRRHLYRWFYFSRNLRNSNFKSKIILASDLYALPGAANLAGKCGAKLLYDSREVYSHLGTLEGSPLKQSIVTFIERKYEKFVDELIVSGELDAEYLKSHFRNQKPYHVILNVPPFRERIESNLLREKFNLSDEIKLALYQGEILKARGIDQSIDAIAELDEQSALVIIGDGPFLEELKSKVHRRKLSKKVFFTGMIPYEKLHEYTCSADVGLSLFEPVSMSYNFALPNKMFEYMMAGLPQLASDLPAMRKIIEETQAGEIVSPELNRRDIISALEALLYSDKTSSYVSNALQAARKYNYEAQHEKIKKILE